MIHWILRILRRSKLRGSHESQFLNSRRSYRGVY